MGQGRYGCRAVRVRALLALLLGAATLPAQPTVRSQLTPSRTRSAPDDLEVTGYLPGLSPQGRGFLSYRQLVALPQTTFTLIGEHDLSPRPRLKLRLQGVSLATLAQALGVPPDADLVEASCTDRYRAHFPAAYIAAHHPVLVLQMEGLPPSAWAVRTHERDPGPYFIAQANFKPAFRILSYTEQLHFPTNVVQLRFSRASETFGRIAPRIDYEPDSPIGWGFRIAQGECLRCHFLGDSGGTKSGREWRMLATWAREQPAFFSAYIRNPQALDAHGHMPAHPTYNAATLGALSAYFQTFAPAPAPKVRP